MFDFIQDFYGYYYIILVLQALCVFHSIRKGNQQKWIWIIVLVPLVGCIAYIFTEVIKQQYVSVIQDTAANLINPGGRISELEKKFKFSDTFINRVALADAYLESGMTEKAIELYEHAGKGVFQDEHVMKQLIRAYYSVSRFDALIRIGEKLTGTINFSKDPANLLYALALEKTGNPIEAEKQFKNMNHRYSNYEARFNYGLFLVRQNKKEDASLVFYDVVEEGENMSRREKGDAASWISRSKEELQRLMS